MNKYIEDITKINQLELMFLQILKHELGSPMALRHLRIPRSSVCRKLMTISIVHGLLTSAKTMTKRDLFYLQKRLYGHQDRSDALIEWLARAIDCPRSGLRVVAASRGLITGDLSWYEKGQLLHISHFGTCGHLIPPSIDLFVSHLDASRLKAVLYVEKETVFYQLNAAELAQKYPICIVTGKGFADLGTRELLSLLSEKLPILGLVDADPHGVAILATLLGTRSRTDPRLLSRKVEWLGIKPTMLLEMGHVLDPSQIMNLNATDLVCCHSLLSKRELPEQWQHELKLMMELDMKAEIEILDVIEPNYVAKVLVPFYLEKLSIFSII